MRQNPEYADILREMRKIARDQPTEVAEESAMMSRIRFPTKQFE